MRCVLFKNILSSNAMIKGSVLKTFDETFDGAPIICCHAGETTTRRNPSATTISTGLFP